MYEGNNGETINSLSDSVIFKPEYVTYSNFQNNVHVICLLLGGTCRMCEGRKGEMIDRVIV